jgi:hypothetical protein
MDKVLPRLHVEGSGPQHAVEPPEEQPEERELAPTR